MKMVFNDPKSGHSFQKEIEKTKEGQLMGKKIGDKIPGSIIGLDGYELQITGGATNDGTPMRFDIPATRYVRALLTQGTGVRKKLPAGTRIKKRVAGNTLAAQTAQVNAKIIQHGTKALGDLGFTLKPKDAKTEEKK